MVNADFGATQPTEILLSPIGASAVERIRLLMVDPLHFKPLMQMVPSGGFVGVNGCALGDPSANECRGAAFAVEHGGDRIAAALADDHDHLALAALITGVASVKAIRLHVGGPDVAAEVAAV